MHPNSCVLRPESPAADSIAEYCNARCSQQTAGNGDRQGCKRRHPKRSPTGREWARILAIDLWQAVAWGVLLKIDEQTFSSRRHSTRLPTRPTDHPMPTHSDALLAHRHIATEQHAVTAPQDCLQVRLQGAAAPTDKTVIPLAPCAPIHRRAQPAGSVRAISTPRRHADFVGPLATRTAMLSAGLAGAFNLAYALSGKINMSRHRARSRPLNLATCLIATSIIAACGGGSATGDQPAAAVALEVSSKGQTGIASSQGSSGSSVGAAALSSALAPAMESVVGSASQETASGAMAESSPAPTPIDLPALAATSADLPDTTSVVAAPGVVTAMSPGAAPDLAAMVKAMAATPSIPAPGSARLAWRSPMTRADGSAIGTLSGYRVYYGSARGAYSGNLFVVGGANMTGTVTGLGAGTWYFTVATVDASGNESGHGYEMSKKI